MSTKHPEIGKGVEKGYSKQTKLNVQIPPHLMMKLRRLIARDTTL